MASVPTSMFVDGTTIASSWSEIVMFGSSKEGSSIFRLESAGFSLDGFGFAYNGMIRVVIPSVLV